MFNKYRFNWNGLDGVEHCTDFYVHSKGTRSGFMHRACAIGALPRLDEKGDSWEEYRENDDKLFAKRFAKVSYCNRTWEYWPGQTCLSKLWEQLNKLKFVDMAQISQTNPFDVHDKPKCECLTEPDELFGPFQRR